MKPELTVYYKLCNEFTKLCKENPGTPAREIPKALAILKAVDVLEEIYPDLLVPTSPQG